MTFEELRQARCLFGLPERATLREIKARYRELARRHHPDRVAGEDAEPMRRINAAYRLLLEYCGSYRFCFAEAEFFEQNPDERLRRQFAQDPVWGGGRAED
jgi:hypothetical protein